MQLFSALKKGQRNSTEYVIGSHVQYLNPQTHICQAEPSEASVTRKCKWKKKDVS